MSLCQSLLKMLEQQAQAGDFRQVKTVWLTLDPAAGVTAEALRFNFELAAKGSSLAEGAELVIAEAPPDPGDALRILELEVL